ncbi:MAG: hypothetical protein Q7U03_13650 [Syntrophales bacterium]|nr:hypothetical protein [Syntrophales bacterium]
MNPMKWPVWIRIAVVVTILWIGVFITWYVDSDRSRPGDVMGCLFPVVLFWGIAWIILGISNHKIKVRVIKILIGIPVVIVTAGTLVFIFIQIHNYLFPSPASLVPQRSEAPLEIAPPASFPYQALPKPGGDRMR